MATGTKTPMPEFPQRVVIENVRPQVEGGRFPIKRCPGDDVPVQATIFTDGADSIGAVIRYRKSNDSEWKESPLRLTNPGKDLWEGEFKVASLGDYDYTVQAWIDSFSTWRLRLKKKFAAGQDCAQDLREGVVLMETALKRSQGEDLILLKRSIAALSTARGAEAAQDETLSAAMQRYADRTKATTHPALRVHVEREKARAASWYEFFPRSAGPTEQRSATFKEAEARLADIAQMGFDIVYLPPIHPIGHTSRKGPNNNPQSKPGDPGSPWAIGSEAGGHTAVHAELGTLADFDHFVQAAAGAGLEVALDLAYQCSPDHPYVREHPEWFHHRPDGTIHYAENPPKKYEDIYPLNFDCPEWQALWTELKNIVLFWIKHQVKIFRVDNPHTKPFRFWEWLIKEVQSDHPETFFLGEAFTRPAVMLHLAASGMSQCYTYFTWRTTKPELIEYFTELTKTEESEYFRPNLFANTPDILHDYLQHGGRAAFQIRLILAATLGASYGIYGPPFELCETQAIPNTEDYVDSEKYQIRSWKGDRPENIKALITQVNRIRRENTALLKNTNLRFFEVDNPALLCYGKSAPEGYTILVIINLDPHNVQSGVVRVPRAELGWPNPYAARDLLTGQTYQWQEGTNFVKLDPHEQPAHIFRVDHAPI